MPAKKMTKAPFPTDLRVGDAVTFYRAMPNHRARYDKFDVVVEYFTKSKVTIRMPDGTLRAVFPDNLQINEESK